MTDSIKATRALVQIGSLEVDGFMLSELETSECVGEPARSSFDFLRSKALKRLLQKGGGTFDFLSENTVTALSTDT